MSIESQKDSLRRLLKHERSRNALKQDEIERLQELNLGLAERLYLCAECLAAAAKRNNLPDLRERIEAFLAQAERPRLP